MTHTTKDKAPPTIRGNPKDSRVFSSSFHFVRLSSKTVDIVKQININMAIRRAQDRGYVVPANGFPSPPPVPGRLNMSGKNTMINKLGNTMADKM